MHFVINETINFDEEQGTLSTDDTSQDPINLTKPSCRLLSLLVRHNDELLTREFLLMHVWEIHGLTASNNNLNNYVSMLRKALGQLGGDNLLVTVPKQGFMLTATSVSSSGEELPLNLPLELTPIKTERYTTHEPGKKRFFTLWAGIFLIVLGTLSATLLLRGEQPIPMTEVTPLGNIDQCQIALLLPPYKQNSLDTLSQVKTLITRLDYNCNFAARVYFYPGELSPRPDGTLKRRSLVVYCLKITSPSSQLHCENTYVNE